MQPVFLIQSVFSNASVLADNSLDPTSAALDQILYISLGRPHQIVWMHCHKSWVVAGKYSIILISEAICLHACSMIFISGDMLGNRRTSTAAFCRKAVVSLTVCCGVLSCWKTVPSSSHVTMEVHQRQLTVGRHATPHCD